MRRLQLLTEEQLDRVNAASLQILEHVGVRVPHEKVLRRFVQRPEMSQGTGTPAGDASAAAAFGGTDARVRLHRGNGATNACLGSVIQAH